MSRPPRMLMTIRPVTTVVSAAQRNQNSAAGAMTLPIAGFCSSGILGMEGICTKLKYQRSPIHITPAITCSQRKKKLNQACSILTVPVASASPATSTTPKRSARSSLSSPTLDRSSINITITFFMNHLTLGL